MQKDKTSVMNWMLWKEKSSENKKYFAKTKNAIAKIKCSIAGLKH